MPRPPLRTYSSLPGNPPSVTAILGAVFPKPELVRWKIDQAARLGQQFPNEDPTGILDRHGPQGMTRGSHVHKAIECMLQELPWPQLTDDERRYFDAFAGWWDAAGIDPVAVEHIVHDPLLGYAGTADLIGTCDSFGVICDWKTCTTLPDEAWPDHKVQLAAYAWTVERPMQGLVLYICPDGVREFWLSPSDLDDWMDVFRNVLGIAAALWPQYWPKPTQLSLVQP